MIFPERVKICLVSMPTKVGICCGCPIGIAGSVGRIGATGGASGGGSTSSRMVMTLSCATKRLFSFSICRSRTLSSLAFLS